MTYGTKGTLRPKKKAEDYEVDPLDIIDKEMRSLFWWAVCVIIAVLLSGVVLYFKVLR